LSEACASAVAEAGLATSLTLLPRSWSRPVGATALLLLIETGIDMVILLGQHKRQAAAHFVIVVYIVVYYRHIYQNL
jgi:hypothetical protein